MDKREERRWFEQRRKERARATHARWHASTPSPSHCCVFCEKERWRIEHSLGCHCRHKRHGNPKIGMGICNTISPLNARDRIDTNRACRRWLRDLRSGIDPVDFA